MKIKQIEDMGNMRFKVGDRVRIKSLDWYNENKDADGIVELSTHVFIPEMLEHCGQIVTIKDVFIDVDGNAVYYMKEIDWDWTDEMIEGLVEEEVSYDTEYEYLKHEITLPQGYQFKDENGNIINAQKIVLEKKKKEYPKTYEECCKEFNVAVRDLDILENMLDTTEIIYSKNLDRLLNSFRKLLICRDAYWQIAGEEMRLGKPWEPDWRDKRYIIYRNQDDIIGGYREAGCVEHHIFEFPIKEIRDAFYENFKELIEQCKELL